MPQTYAYLQLISVLMRTGKSLLLHMFPERAMMEDQILLGNAAVYFVFSLQYQDGKEHDSGTLEAALWRVVGRELHLGDVNDVDRRYG